MQIIPKEKNCPTSETTSFPGDIIKAMQAIGQFPPFTIQSFSHDSSFFYLSYPIFFFFLLLKVALL